MINREFSGLNNTRLNYTTHLYGCCIKEVLINLVWLNAQLIKQTEEAVLKLKKTDFFVAYRQGWRGKLVLKFASDVKCTKKNREQSGSDLGRSGIFTALDQQHQKIKQLLDFCIHSDVNTNVIPYGRWGLFKVSAGDMFEYMLTVQKQHFMLARRILMLQDL
jgi:hypothetical protein